MKPVILPLMALTLFLSNCSSFNLKPLLRNQNIAIFSVADSVYPNASADYRAEIPVPTTMPALSKEKIMAILGNFQYRKNQLWGDIQGPIYTSQELSQIADQMIETLPILKEKERLIVVNRFDPDHSVLSRLHLNSLLLWHDKAGLNLVFGVIHETLPSDDFYIDKNWYDILPINMKRSYRDLSLVPADFFTYKKIKKLEHKTWAIIPLNKLSTLKYVDPQKIKKSATKSDADQKLKKETPTMRLSVLKKAHAEGLITDEEYTKQREVILKDF